jgi:hypothetical protein
MNLWKIANDRTLDSILIIKKPARMALVVLILASSAWGKVAKFRFVLFKKKVGPPALK